MRKLFSVLLVMALATGGLIALAGPAAAAPACSDGIDNDGDGLKDYPADPGCDSPADEHEEPVNLPAAGSSCRASVARITGPLPTIEPFVANKKDVPCKDDAATLLTPTTIGPLSAGAVEAYTFASPITFAFARVAGANIAIGPGIFAETLRANASVTCVGGAPTLGSDSEVVRLIIGTSPIKVPNGHFHIVIPGVGTLHLNETTTAPGSVTRRALWLTTPSSLLPDVVVAEAHADFTGNPCAS